MSHTLELLAFTVIALTALLVLVMLSQPLVRRRVMVLRLRRDMRQIEVAVVDWKRDLGTPR